MDYPFKFTADNIVEFYQVFDKYPNRYEFVKAMLQEYDAMITCDVVLIWQCFEYAENEGIKKERKRLVEKIGNARAKLDMLVDKLSKPDEL